MKYLRWLLLPFSLLYGVAVVVRNWCYDAGFFKSREFDMPVISVGNLDVGGAGKSPMTEYLVRLLKSSCRTATLSRGYGRKTTGFVLADSGSSPGNIGDEPAQFKQKFPDVTVAVCEERATGIDKLKADHDVIILDDAFQHRSVKPGFSILLFDYNKLFDPHFLLPAGNLREPFSGKWRADMFVISKCPSHLTQEEKTRCYYRVAPHHGQPLFFSAINYLPLQDIHGNAIQDTIDVDTTVFLLTGIANPIPLYTHLKTFTQHIIHHNYADHHQFTLKNIAKLANTFNACPSQKKVIITTEKDAQRLGVRDLAPAIAKLPISVLPIGVEFLDNSGHEFDKLILNYVREYTEHN
ncbi:tetraacyldisaccharide 4'-kinase [Mucilaginibacter terrenus]|uniref:Tetraacyldisaccharide 4'-kinase n=2 Tax=Mucilaginibacter terrenus TaxID=2482727 RepID=A0A3E2NXZ7_9SPHI|nr:tetraacyldisaccharide 4'-kinase [Mucilaginibacter terrenus]